MHSYALYDFVNKLGTYDLLTLQANINDPQLWAQQTSENDACQRSMYA